METDNKNKIDAGSNDYSWFKVHFKSITKSARVLLYGVVKNFRRITWHSKKGLTLEYIQVIAVLIFMTLFCFAIFLLVSHI